ncbi:hypothetical protein [Hymenobacter sp. DG01]|uniref:hypothetical protein n=1 Tax=Hymenobacter sp. DG01 TaxID=2584940 RepID=UPI00112483FF|nr:hypothetical protein [Hymenobacter sp. DG01]
MARLQEIKEWIEAGKQIGKSLCYMREGKVCWLVVGLQKWQGVYKLYSYEILEEDMAAEKFIYDKLRCFESFDELVKATQEDARISIEEYGPLKGQRLFSPNFDCD